MCLVKQKCWFVIIGIVRGTSSMGPDLLGSYTIGLQIGVSKKTGKPIKPRKPKKKKPKKPNRKKNRLNRLYFWKNWPIRFVFGFISKKPKKPNRTEPKPTKNRKKTEKTEPKPEKTEPNRFEPVFALKNRTETGRFDPVSVRFRFFFSKKIISVWFLFLIKTEPNRKWSPLAPD